MRLLTLFTFALALTFASCGKSEDDAKGANAVEAPPFECATFEKRVYECSEEFSLGYVGTEFGKRTVGKTPEEKANAIKKVLKIVKSVDSQNACNVPAWGNLAEKGPHWQVRYNKCKADAPCAEWGKCVGEALGAPLKI